MTSCPRCGARLVREGSDVECQNGCDLNAPEPKEEQDEQNEIAKREQESADAEIWDAPARDRSNSEDYRLQQVQKAARRLK